MVSPSVCAVAPVGPYRNRSAAEASASAIFPVAVDIVVPPVREVLALRLMRIRRFQLSLRCGTIRCRTASSPFAMATSPSRRSKLRPMVGKAGIVAGGPDARSAGAEVAIDDDALVDAKSGPFRESQVGTDADAHHCHVGGQRGAVGNPDHARLDCLRRAAEVEDDAVRLVHGA